MTYRRHGRQWGRGRCQVGARMAASLFLAVLASTSAIAADTAAKVDGVMAMTLLDPAGRAGATEPKPEDPAQFERWTKPLLLLFVMTDDPGEGTDHETAASRIVAAAQAVGIEVQTCVLRLDQAASPECLAKSPDILLGSVVDARHVQDLWAKATAIKFADPKIRATILTRLRDMLVGLKTGKTCQSSNLSTGGALSGSVLVNHVFDPSERQTCALVLAFRALGVTAASPTESIAGLGERLAALTDADARPEDALKYLYSEGLRPGMSVADFRTELDTWLKAQP